MKSIAIPKSVLIHEIVYAEYKGRDDWNNVSFKDPVTIKKVRFDLTTVYSRDSQETKIVAEGIVFVDCTYSTPVFDFQEQSKITFEGKDYVVQKVIPCYLPKKNIIRHFELEVL